MSFRSGDHAIIYGANELWEGTPCVIIRQIEYDMSIHENPELRGCRIFEVEVKFCDKLTPLVLPENCLKKIERFQNWYQESI